tara:strand:+ start:10942 stop:11214 length:273 start_codon:yes stop_codon:yes gene_type:complete
MKKLDLIALLLLGIIALSLILSLFKSTSTTIEGYTQQEVNYLLEIQSLKNDKKLLNYEIERFKDKIISDSAFVHNATNNQIDSLFTDYFK